ncbi:MAG: pilus assembly protein [Ornithinimicrobium sp.]
MTRPWNSRSRSERGSALIEVTFLMIVLLLPLFYLVGTVGRLQAGAYAASGAAREAGRAYVTSPDDVSAPARSLAAAQFVFDAHGFDSGEGNIAVVCATSPCLTPGSALEINSTVQVPLPLIPSFMSGAVPTSITMTGRHTEPVDEFRARSSP